MLIEFSVENYFSIKEKQTISLVSGKFKELTKNVYYPDEISNLGILKSAVIYGANAAGKSNLLLAVRSMVDIIIHSSSNNLGEPLPITSFKLSSKTINAPTEFEIVFIVDGVRYQYGFSATSDKIVDEWLFAYPKGRAQKWFERSWNDKTLEFDWDFGSYLLGEKQVWQKSTRDNALFLSTAVQLNSEQLKPLFSWFKNSIKLSGVSGWSNRFSASRCMDEYKSNILNFLKSADVGINDIFVKKEKFDPNEVPNEVPDELRKAIIESMSGEDLYDISTVHINDEGKEVRFSLGEESHGTQKLFALAGPWLDALDSGYTILIDELHDALHPKLVTYLVNLFNDEEFNKKGAQLIFSTHETSILNQNIFRRDQIWFCEKNELSETNIYPLTDYSPRKGRENLEASYLDGRYGALPFITRMEK
ncbi:ATP/GTP-binding protein [Providencia vermicola]|uniref:AAA family ATPase n=1 Tax=Providencia TaxID=586 RepID=UPI0012397EC7|nr:MULTISPECIES: ATP-binding protein [Providencia]ELR5120906.1 ATP-binding protein [Providencia stuartii]ELX8377527.1 ATP-binding protein [Providencia stuartii]EMD5257068.1 ATP-binding protein [Providencia stuartii]MDT2016851.1 ATP-binding protein [Providencia stuartii]MDT2082906.1 ATP-binding protein [Providencia stuartii]